MSEPVPFAKQAAKASWLAPLIAVALGIVGRMMMARASNAGLDANPDTTRIGTLIFGGICIFIVLVGLGLGVAALFGIRKHGMRGILVPAIIGILLSSGYLAMVINAFIVVARLASERG